MQLSYVTRFLTASLLAVSLAVTATAQPRPSAPKPASPPPASPSAPAPRGGGIQAIEISGNQRIEAGTIRSYMLVRPGDPFDPDRLDRTLKTLFSTGLFEDVQLGRRDGVLIVKIVENPLVNRVAFEGNKKVDDAAIKAEIQARPRAVFTPGMIESDKQKILELYAKKGNFDTTVEPKIIRQDQNRVDVVFQISDGGSALINKIAIVGNHAFSESRLIEAIMSRESRWWRFLSSSDQYDAERVNVDKELLRRFYLKNGYADVDVLTASAELSPDHKGFFVTFAVKEGDRYKLGSITIASQIKGISGDDLKSVVEIREGDWYDGDAVGRAADVIEDAVHNRAYAFVEVKPRFKKDLVKHAVDIVYEVGEGPRVYVERIDINGNTRTKDKVVRREFRLVEGDAFNADLIRKTRTRLTDLGYFGGVEISTAPGSAPDRAIVTTRIAEKATGELSFGGGYSTDAGALIDIGLAERNMVGTGVNASINGVLAQKRSSLNLSVTDPYFLDRNLVAGIDLFMIQTQYLGTQPYDERRAGGALRLGYDFNEHLRQVWSYSIVNRNVYNVTSTSPLILNEKGTTLLSQVSQTLSLDYRDSKLYPHKGWAIDIGADYAGLGGSVDFVRTNVAAAYYIPLERYFDDDQWGIKLSGAFGYMIELPGGKDLIIDRFFLGGDNLRGFATGGAGPHDANSGDPLGGRFLWSQSSELRFPLPGVPRDIGLTGRTFIDVGSLTGASFKSGSCTNCGTKPISIVQSGAPRVGAGVGISWRTQFGLINVDVAPFVVKQQHDQTQFFRFGFGTRF